MILPEYLREPRWQEREADGKARGAARGGTTVSRGTPQTAPLPAPTFGTGQISPHAAFVASLLGSTHLVGSPC